MEVKIFKTNKTQKCTAVTWLLFILTARTISTENVVTYNAVHREPINLDDYADLVNNETIPPSDIESSCKAFIDKYADVSSQFTRCSIENARPLRFCENCVVEYVMAKSVFKVIMEGLAKDEKGHMCGEFILNADKIQLISQTESFIERIWNDGLCENCFETMERVNDTVEYILKDDFKTFKIKANQTWQCFVNHTQGIIQPFIYGNSSANNTVCKDCTDVYKVFNEFYLGLESKYSHGVCMDIVDMMNQTRMLWSGDFKCSRPNIDVVLVLIASGVFASLPVVFYIAAKYYGTKKEHRIIQQKRYADSQTVVSTEVPQNGEVS